MWLLLVAAGSGYLARCWQHAEKSKHAHLEHSAHTKQDEPIKRLHAGNTPPNSPATRVPRSKSLPASLFAKKLRDGVAKEGPPKDKDLDDGGDQLHGVDYGEIVGKDRADLADSSRVGWKEQSSTLRGTLSSDESTVFRSLSLHDRPRHLQGPVEEATPGSEGAAGAWPESVESPTGLVEESDSFSESESRAGVENPDEDLQKDSISVTTALSTEESHIVLHCAPDTSSILQQTADEEDSAECFKEQEVFVSEESKAVLEEDGFSFRGTLQQNTPERRAYFQFQAQRKYRKARLRKPRREGIMDQHCEKTETELGDNIGGKGRVSLSYLTGKRLGDPRRSAASDGCEGTRADDSRTRTKYGEESITESMGRHSSSFGRGLVAQSDCYLKLNIAGPYGQPPKGVSQRGSYSRKLRTPNKLCKGRPVGRKVRAMRASPKPVSSLECCLRAQILDDLDRNQERHVNRPLNFSSVVEETGQRSGSCEDDNMIGGANCATGSLDNDGSIDKPGRIRGLVGLPQLQKVLSLDSCHNSEGCRKKALLPITLKKRKMSHMRQLSSSSAGHGTDVCTSKEVTRAPVEGLMFSFGVGIGVMSTNKFHKSEVEGLQQSLEEAESEVQALRRILQQHGLPLPELNRPAKAGRKDTDGKIMAGVVEGAEEEHLDDDFASLRVLVTEGASSLQDDQMADLEAELEAELEHLTGQFPDLDELELDGVAAVVHGDLNVKGLPAQVDSDGDDNSAPEVACINNYAVSPRELTRLLRKLQATRQEERIAELEADLETTQSELQTREQELHLWKDRVRRLTELSLSSPAQGDTALLCTPSSGVITPEQPSPTSDSEAEPKTEVHVGTPLEGQGSFHFPLQSTASTGKVLEKSLSKSRRTVEKDPAGSAKHSTLGKVEPRLTRDASFRQPSSELLTQEDRPAVDRRLDFGVMRDNSWTVTDDFCDEFLRSMEDSNVDIPAQHDQVGQSNTDSTLIFEDSQIAQLLLDSVQDLGSLEVGETSVMGSNTPSVYDYSSAVSMSDGWDNGPKPITSKQFRAGALHQIVSGDSDRAKTASYMGPTDSSMSVSEVSDGEEYHRSGTTPPFKYGDSRSRPQATGDQSMTPFFWNRDGGGLGRAGANTPIDGRFASSQSTTNIYIQMASKQQERVIMDRQQVDLNPTVYNKIAGWEGLIRREPSPLPRSDWEGHSQASESDRHGGGGAHLVKGDPFCEESLVSEAEEYFGNILINHIVERTSRGSDIVRDAQTKLATPEPIGSGRGGNPDSPLATVSSAKRASRKVRNKDGKLAEEEEYELLCKTLPKRFEAVRVSDDRDYERAVFSRRLDPEEYITEFDNASVSEEGSVSKFSSREEYGKATTDADSKGKGRWPLHGGSRQSSPFKSGSGVEGAWSQRRV